MPARILVHHTGPRTLTGVLFLAFSLGFYALLLRGHDRQLQFFGQSIQLGKSNPELTVVAYDGGLDPACECDATQGEDEDEDNY